MAQYEMGLHDYWRILRKRWLAVFLTCLAAGGLTFFLTQHVFRTPPTFQADCKVSVLPEEALSSPNPMAVNAARQAEFVKSEDLLLDTLWAVERLPFGAVEPARDAAAPHKEKAELRRELLRALRSHTRVATLRELTYLFEDQASSKPVRDILAIARNQEQAKASDQPPGKIQFLHDNKDLRDAIVSQLQSRTEVEYNLVASSLKITVQTTAPGFEDENTGRGRDAAVHIAETLATVYKAYTEWRGRRVINKEISRISQRIGELQLERTEAEQGRDAKQKELDAKDTGDEEHRARAARDQTKAQLAALQRYQKRLDNYFDDRAKAERENKPYPTVPLPLRVVDANIQRLGERSIAIQQEKNKKLDDWKPGSYEIRALNNQLDLIAKQLKETLESAVSSQQVDVAEAQAALDRAQTGREEPARLRREIGRLAQRINDLSADIRARTARSEELKLFAEKGIRVDILDSPGTPEEIGRAGAVAKTVVGALIGLVLGVVIAVLWETFDLTIGTIEEVETFLETRVLGVIPHIEADKLAADIRGRDPESEADTSDAELQQRATLVTLYDPKSVPAEAFRHVRTSLDFARQQAGPDAKVFLITSATLYEGKTTVASNLAMAMAQKGKRTCLIECDLRRPQLHRVFGLGRRPGLHDVFIGKTTWQEAQKSLSDLLLGKIGMKAAVGAPGLENLSILTCGTVPPNPVELLDSDETRTLFTELRAAFDAVVVDSPPILPVADAAVVSRLCDGAVLVYRAGAAPRTVLSRAKTELESVGTNLFGVVLNDLRPAAGEVSATYPYKGYARRAYALPEEQTAAPRVPAATTAPLAVDRASEDTEEQALRKIDLLLSQGKADEALQAAHDAAQALPQSISVRLQLARAYAAGRRESEAQAELIHVLDLDPRNLAALRRLAQMAADAALDVEALRWCEEILEIAPDDPDAQAQVAAIQARLGTAGAPSA